MTVDLKLIGTIEEMNYLFLTANIRCFESINKIDDNVHNFNVVIRVSEDVGEMLERKSIRKLKTLLAFLKNNDLFEPFVFNKNVNDKCSLIDINYPLMGYSETMISFFKNILDKQLVIRKCIYPTMDSLGGYHCSYVNKKELIKDPIEKDKPFLFDDNFIV